MQAEVINKLNITPEARFDVFESLCFDAFDWRTLKKETEEYIEHMTASGKLPWRGYFRCDYIDENSGVRLKLFVYRGIKIGPMQYWELKGVCEAAKWSQEAEDDGLVRVWIETKIENLPETEDWTVYIRTNQILKTTEKTLWENVLTEVRNEFEYDRDKETAEGLAFLQGIHFEKRGRGLAKKKVRRYRRNG